MKIIPRNKVVMNTTLFKLGVFPNKHQSYNEVKSGLVNISVMASPNGMRTTDTYDVRTVKALMRPWKRRKLKLKQQSSPVSGSREMCVFSSVISPIERQVKADLVVETSEGWRSKALMEKFAAVNRMPEARARAGPARLVFISAS